MAWRPPHSSLWYMFGCGADWSSSVSDLVKTTTFKELAPYDGDWYYIRAGMLPKLTFILNVNVFCWLFPKSHAWKQQGIEYVWVFCSVDCLDSRISLVIIMVCMWLYLKHLWQGRSTWDRELEWVLFARSMVDARVMVWNHLILQRAVVPLPETVSSSRRGWTL